MSQHWTLTLKNVVSPELRDTWAQMAHVFNRQIEQHDTPEGERWKVLQPATGTGKSQGLAVFCSLLPEIDHPGVLVVVRLKVQADELVQTINTLTGREDALAYHTDHKVPLSKLAEYPVLVITHRAYEIGLDAVNQGRQDVSNWNHFHTWGLSTRRLLVIDEALDILEEAQIELQKVKVARAIIPLAISMKYPKQMEALKFVEDLLTQMGKVSQERRASGRPDFERVLWSSSVPMPQELDMTALRRELRSLRLDRELTLRNDPQANTRLADHYDTILRDVQAVLSNWNWYAKKLAQHTINTARLIIPEGISGATILDATASSNLIYQLFDAKVDVIPVPAKARSYENVTLHVSTGHSVGKAKMVEHAAARSAVLIENLTAALTPDRRVFVCCHQWVEPHVAGYRDASGFAAFDVGHWNAVDGRNDWQDYDTAVIFGLPYRDQTWSANVFMALRGLQSTEWLQSEERPFRQYKDVRHSLDVGQMTVQVVQAINRVHCRRVVDEQGNCPKTDVFLLLPADKVGRDILAGINREMPGIQVVEWKYQTGNTTVKKSNHAESLMRYAAVMEPGQKSASDVKRELGISSTQWERLVIGMKDSNCTLAQTLASHGVRYTVAANKSGGGFRANLTKD